MPLQHRRKVWLAVASALCASVPAQAQITTDGTLGPAKALSGPNFAIPADLGRQAGANLFHSFGLFNVPTGGSATFSGPSSVSNIISRVTGGQVSSIDGRLASTIQGANLFLINPRGILFGPNASLDLTGSFTASTANYLKLADGTRFEASATVNPILSAAPPAAFGFLEPTGSITVQGSQLQVAEGKSINLVGGPVTVSDASLHTIAGDIRIVGVGGTGEASLGGNVAPGTALAPVALARSTLSTQSAPGLENAPGLTPGRILIRGGQLTVTESSLASTNNEQADAPPIELAASGDLTLRASNITSSTGSSGRGADIALSGENVTVDHNSQVGSLTWGDGRGGDVALGARNAVRVVAAPEDPNYTNVYSEAHGAGAAGDIRASGDTVTVQSGNLYSYTAGDGATGSVIMRGREVGVTNGAYVYTLSDWGTGGRTGDIDIAATARLSVSGADWNGYVAQVFTSTYGSGNGGGVTLRAPSVLLSRGLVNVGANWSGNAGDILVEADALRVAGDGTGGSRIGSDLGYWTSGHGGNITLRAFRSLELDGSGGNSMITSATAYTSTGDAGNITIESPHVMLRGPAMIYVPANGSGNGGNVVIRTQDIELGAGTSIASDNPPWGTGQGGNITIEGTGRLTMATTPIAWFDHWHLHPDDSQIIAWTGGPGNAGNVTISIPEIYAGLNSHIVSYTFGAGDAGTITINADRVKLADTSAIITSTESGTGNAGRIVLNIGERFEMTDRGFYNGVINNLFAGSPLSTRGGVLSVSAGPGNPGSVVLRAPVVLLDDARIQVSTRESGHGGRIEIQAGDLTLRNGGQIDAKTLPGAFGDAGSIAIDVGNRFEISGISPIDGAFSGVNAETRGSGHGGDVAIRAGTIAIDRGFVQSSTGAAGNAGTIDVRAQEISLLNGGVINAGTAPGSTGAGGSVSIAATGAIVVGGIDRSAPVPVTLVYDNPVYGNFFTLGRAQGPASSAISSNTAGSGAGGNVSLSAPSIRIEGGGRITATSTGTGNAGSINITASDALRIFGGSTISSEALQADGGNIDIRVGNLVHLKNSEITTAVGSGAGAGGNVFIDPTFVILENSRIAANAFGGPGGNIQIFATYFLNTLDSLVDASSQAGIPGTVQISAPNTNLSTQIKVLPAAFFDATQLVREACSARGMTGGNASSLVGVGRGGLAASPERFATSTYFGNTPMAVSSSESSGLKLVTAKRARLMDCAG